MSERDGNDSTSASPPHVVIIGGGFGGIAAATGLADAPVRITLIDRRNHHLFQPLLYQVATAGLAPADIAHPIRSILARQSNARVVLGDVVDVDTEGRRVRLADGGEFTYDHLVLATGTRHSYFGNDQWEQHAPGLKTVEDALEIRRRVLLAFERAERADDPDERQAQLTFVVVGGGPTGVETAGAIAEIAFRTLTSEFRSIDPSTAQVILLEAAPRILGAYSEKLSTKAERQLRAARCRRPDRRAGDRHRRSTRRHVDRRHLGPHRHLGRGERGVAARSDGRRRHRPGGSGHRRPRPVGRRTPRGLRHRRHGPRRVDAASRCRVSRRVRSRAAGTSHE